MRHALLRHSLPRLLASSAALTLLMAAAARTTAAQTPTFGVTAGGSIPTADFGDAYSSGYNVGAFVGVRPTSLPFGLRLEGTYNRFDAKNNVDANTSILSGTVNAVFSGSGAPGTLRPYFLGGVGGYYVKASANVRSVTVSSSDTKFGVNGGVGLDIPLSGIAVFVEGRYHYVFTKTDGLGANTGYVPIVVGVRF